MQQCPNCGFLNRPGIVFCENCGTSLIGQAAAAETSSLDKETKQLDSNSLPEHANVTVEEIKDTEVQGTDLFPEGGTLRLEIDGSPDPIVIPVKKIVVFGRRDPATGAMPDVDLTPYAGYRMGVSRKHAEIRASQEGKYLELWVLGSSNGSFLNSNRLTAHRPYRLHSGDEIRLGQLVIHIFYEKA